MTLTRPFTLGAVAYDPKVVTIWEGFKDWFADPRLRLRLRAVLELRGPGRGAPRRRTSTSPGTRRWPGCAPAASPRPPAARPGPSRCATPTRTSRRWCSCAPTATSPTSASSPGARVATGADRLAPGDAAAARPPRRRSGSTRAPAFTVRRFDVMVGKHGDHVGGERDAVRALVDGEVDAACVIDGNQLLFAKEGTIAAGAVRVLTRTAPYDHCTMTVLDDVDQRRRRPVRRAAAVDVVRRPRRAAAARARGAARWRPGRTHGLRASSRRRSTGSASTAPTARSSWRATRRDRRAAPSSSSARSGSTAAPTSSSSSRSPSRRPATRSACAARIPTSPATSPPGAASRVTAWRRRRDPDDVTAASSASSSAASGVGARWVGAERAGRADPIRPARSTPTRRPAWGLAAAGRGDRARRARRRASGSTDRDEVWTDRAAGLYAQAAAAQWDPAAAIDWATPIDHGRARRGRRRPGDDVPRSRTRRRRSSCPPGSSARSTRTSARSSRSSPSPSPTRPATSRCSPGAPR